MPRRRAAEVLNEFLDSLRVARDLPRIAHRFAFTPISPVLLVHGRPLDLASTLFDFPIRRVAGICPHEVVRDASSRPFHAVLPALSSSSRDLVFTLCKFLGSAQLLSLACDSAGRPCEIKTNSIANSAALHELVDSPIQLI